MKSKQYDIFISYRREGGMETADAIYQRLQNAGYSVFLDLEQLKSGKFNEQLLSVIDGCTDFIVVLPPNALDRCCDEEDWVRREVEYAIEKGKNIIPVMLRGFDWPDNKSTLPESMRELPNYEGIAATDYKLFPENMERLKTKLLLSKPGITWHRYKTLFISAILILLTMIGVLFAYLWSSKTEYEMICNEYSMKMMTEFVKMHHNALLAQDGLESFEEYYEEHSDDAKLAKQNLKNSINLFRKQLQMPNKLVLSEHERGVLRRYKLQLQELDAMYLVADEFYKEVNYYFDNIEQIISQEDLSKVLKENVRLNYEFIELYVKGCYYDLLSIYATMPSIIYAQLQPTTAELELVGEVPMRLSEDEYTAMSQLQINKMNSVLQKMGRDVVATALMVEQQEATLANMSNELQAKIEETYNNLLAQCQLTPDEEINMQWYKIVLFGHFVYTLSDFCEEIQMDCMEYTSYLTPQYAVEKLYDLLDKYQTYHPETEAYVCSTRAYFTEISSRKRVYSGVIVRELIDSHPYIQLGDIIIGYNNQTITNLESLKTAYQHNANGSVKILRLENNVLKEITVSSFGNTDIIGFWDITLPEE
jgi:hypothetical protein